MVTIVWMVLTLVAAVLFLMVGGLCISGVLGPVAMAALARPPAGWAESRYEEPSGVKSPDVACRVPFAGLRQGAMTGSSTLRINSDELTPTDREAIAKKQTEVRENVRRRHEGYGRQDDAAGLVRVDVRG